MPKRTKRYSNIGERIKSLRVKHGFTQKQLGEKLNKSESSVRMWELGYSEPDIDTLGLLSSIFSVRIDYITGNDNDDEFDIFSIPGISPIKTKKLPLLGRIACGKPIFADEEYDGYIEVDEGITADFCLRAQGDSMINARIYDGDIVFVKQQSSVNNGEIAVILIGDEATLKRVFYYPDKQKLVLNPENTKYEPLVFIGEELNEIKILGKAIVFQSIVR